MKDVLLKSTMQIREVSGSGPQAHRVVISKLLEFCANIAEYDVRELKIPGGTIDLAVDFAGVDNVIFLMIHSDKALKLKVNGTTDETSAGTDFMFTGSSLGYLTSLLLSNPGSDEASVLVVMGGQP